MKNIKKTKILHSQPLVDKLRDKCNGAKHRIWIISPFIGSIKEVKKIIGASWTRSSIDFKVITDGDSGFIRPNTFDEFKKYGEIRSLNSIHAKVYIIDDWCLITSANLTGTAFSRRYEIGIEIEDKIDLIDIESTFSIWWDNAIDLKIYINKGNPAIINYQDNNLTFSKKWNLPTYNQITAKNDKYLTSIELYKQFNDFYEKETGRISEMVKDGFTLFQETDYLFNYLYHEHPEKVTREINEVRNISEKERTKELTKYFKQLSTFYNEQDKQLWRLERTNIIQSMLNPKNIDKLTWNDVKSVVNCFHCYSSYPINRTKFLNNNELQSIIDNWKNLLHNGDINNSIVQQTIHALHYFGPSSVYELIGWYYTDKYPLMNKNSDSGMRFFGYNI